MGKVSVDTTYHQEIGPIPDGLYAVEVTRRDDGVDNPSARKTANGKNQLMWTLKILQTEPGKEAQKGRTVNHFTLNHSDKEKDQTWPTVNMLRAVGVTIGVGERKSFDTNLLLGRRCGVVIVTQDDREGKPRSNVTKVMSLDDYAKQMTDIRNEYERNRQVAEDNETVEETETLEVDVDSETLAS